MRDVYNPSDLIKTLIGANIRCRIVAVGFTYVCLYVQRNEWNISLFIFCIWGLKNLHTSMSFSIRPLFYFYHSSNSVYCVHEERPCFPSCGIDLGVSALLQTLFQKWLRPWKFIYQWMLKLLIHLCFHCLWSYWMASYQHMFLFFDNLVLVSQARLTSKYLSVDLPS